MLPTVWVGDRPERNEDEENAFPTGPDRSSICRPPVDAEPPLTASLALESRNIVPLTRLPPDWLPDVPAARPTSPSRREPPLISKRPPSTRMPNCEVRPS